LAATLGERERTALVQILLGAVTLQPERIVTALTELAEPRGADLPALRSVVQAALRRIRHGQFPGFSWLLKMLDEAALATRLRFAADLTLLRKALHIIAGVAADIAAGGHGIDRVLVRDFLGHLVGEWPQRWISLPGSRAFPTRVSNADLAELMLGLPATATRFWLEHYLDLFDGQGSSARAGDIAE
jgi:hypothetical protein